MLIQHINTKVLVLMPNDYVGDSEDFLAECFTFMFKCLNQINDICTVRVKR